MSTKPIEFYHIQNSFSRGLLSQYNANSGKDFQTGELYASQSLSVAKNVIIEKEQGPLAHYSKLVHKRFSTKVLSVIQSDYIRLVPYIKQITEAKQTGQVFALTTQENSSVINFIGDDRSVVQALNPVKYANQQLKELDYTSVKNRLFLAHWDIPTQTYTYTDNNPSFSDFAFSSTISGDQTKKYDGIFRSLRGIVGEEKISVTVTNSSLSIVLSNNYSYFFKVGDVLKFVEQVDPAQILGYLDASRLDPMYMIVRITAITSAGTQATYEVINGSTNIATVLGKEINITSVFLNFDNNFFNDKQKYPSSLLLTTDQRLGLLIDDEIHLSEQGNYFSFFFLAKDFVKATAPRGHRSFQPNEKNSGYKMVMVGDQIITFNGNSINISSYKLAQFQQRTLKIKNNTFIKPVVFGEMVFFVDDTSSTIRVMPFGAKEETDIYNLFDYSDNFIGKSKIVQIAIEHSPLPRLYILLDNGTMLINNLGLREVKREGVVIFEHSNGKIEDIVSLDFNGGSILVMAIKQIAKDGTTFFTIEEYINKKTYYGTEDVLLDGMFVENIDLSSQTYINNSLEIQLYNTGLLDDKQVSIFVPQYNIDTQNTEHIRLQGESDSLFTVKNNGKIYISQSSLESFSGNITLYIGNIFESKIAQSMYNMYDSQNGTFNYSYSSYEINEVSLQKETSSNFYVKFNLYNPITKTVISEQGPDLINVIFPYNTTVSRNVYKIMPEIHNKDSYFFCINTLCSKIRINTNN